MAKNIKQLRDALLTNFAKLEGGIYRDADLDRLKEMNRTAQNILHSAKIELAYAKMHDRKSKIEFLETPTPIEPDEPGNLRFINPPTDKPF